MTDSVAEAPSPVLNAIRNGVKLGMSLLFTWGIALGMRLLLPRYLGPARFGSLNFADAFTGAFFVTIGLGVDTYVRKEVAVRPDHASDFWGGIFAIRCAMAVGIFAIIGGVLAATHRDPEIVALVFLFGLAQFFVVSNATFSAMLHARGSVNEMSVLAVATKVIWALGSLIVLFRGTELWGYGAAYLASESLETLFLYRLAKKHLRLSFRVDRTATKAMLLSSLPYYLTVFATTAYGKLDVTFLDFIGNSKEVGWYGAASAVAGLALLVTPLIDWVLTPMYAQAAARSREELLEQVRRSMELILNIAIPASLMLSLGADVWIGLIFGRAFSPAVPALRILSVMFVLIYVAIVYSRALTMMDRGWAVTMVSLVGLAVNPALNLLVIKRGMTAFGEGGGGTACASVMLITEVVVTVCMMASLRGSAFDRRSLLTMAKSVLACLVVAGLHATVLRPLGPLRLVVDALLYGAFAVGTGALRIREIAGFLSAALRKSDAL